MATKTVRLSIPAEPAFARTVRMTAATLAVTCGMSIDDVEDVRMAAEEGFVYSCATQPASCDVAFRLDEGLMSMDFSLGPADPEDATDPDAPSLDLVELLLSAVCADFGIEGDVLTLSLRMGA